MFSGGVYPCGSRALKCLLLLAAEVAQISTNFDDEMGEQSTLFQTVIGHEISNDFHPVLVRFMILVPSDVVVDPSLFVHHPCLLL